MEITSKVIADFILNNNSCFLVFLAPFLGSEYFFIINVPCIIGKRDYFIKIFLGITFRDNYF